VINAAIHLGLPGVDPNSDEYERLVDYVSARHDGADYIDRAIDYLGLDCFYHDGADFRYIKQYLDDGIPVAADVYIPSTDEYHSCLIVDYQRRPNGIFVKVPNIGPTYSSPRMWMAWNKLRDMIVVSSSHMFGHPIGHRKKIRRFFVFAKKEKKHFRGLEAAA